MFAPPSARRIFFKCALSNLKSWIRPWFPSSIYGLWLPLWSSIYGLWLLLWSSIYGLWLPLWSSVYGLWFPSSIYGLRFPSSIYGLWLPLWSSIYGVWFPGADPEGGAPGARPSESGKNMIFWRKIVIFHTKYPQNFRASLRSVQFFKVHPP